VRPQVGVRQRGAECRRAKAATLQLLLDQAMRRNAAVVIVDAELSLRPRRRVHHGLADGERVGHNLLAQHVRSGLKRLQHRLLVIPLQRGHRNDIRPLLLQHLLNRGVGAEVVLGGERLGTHAVAAADGGGLGVRVSGICLCVKACGPACSNDCGLQLLHGSPPSHTFRELAAHR
jgi:hypothetical protein